MIVPKNRCGNTTEGESDKMKKRTVTLLISLALSLSLFGCGGSGRDTKQEEPQQEANADVEQEETKEEEKIEYEEFEYFYVAEIYDSDKVIPCNLDNLDIEGIYCGDWKLTNSIDLYSRREGGVAKVGYTKENIPINVFASNKESEWIQLLFNKEEQPNTYLIIKVEDFLANSDYDESKSNYAKTEEPIAEKQITEEDRIYNEVMELFDEDKTYTVEEFYYLMQDAAEIIGVDFSSDVAQESSPETWTINLTGNKLKGTYESLITYMLFGPDGIHKMDFYFGLTEQNPDTSGDFDIYIFLRYHKD